MFGIFSTTKAVDEKNCTLYKFKCFNGTLCGELTDVPKNLTNLTVETSNECTDTVIFVTVRKGSVVVEAVTITGQVERAAYPAEPIVSKSNTAKTIELALPGCDSANYDTSNGCALLENTSIVLPESNDQPILLDNYCFTGSLLSKRIPVGNRSLVPLKVRNSNRCPRIEDVFVSNSTAGDFSVFLVLRNGAIIGPDTKAPWPTPDPTTTPTIEPTLGPTAIPTAIPSSSPTLSPLEDERTHAPVTKNPSHSPTSSPFEVERQLGVACISNSVTCDFCTSIPRKKTCIQQYGCYYDPEHGCHPILCGAGEDGECSPEKFRGTDVCKKEEGVCRMDHIACGKQPKTLCKQHRACKWSKGRCIVQKQLGDIKNEECFKIQNPLSCFEIDKCRYDDLQGCVSKTANLSRTASAGICCSVHPTHICENCKITYDSLSKQEKSKCNKMGKKCQEKQICYGKKPRFWNETGNCLKSKDFNRCSICKNCRDQDIVSRTCRKKCKRRQQSKCFGKQGNANGRVGLARKRSSSEALIAAFPSTDAGFNGAPKNIVLKKLHFQNDYANVARDGFF